MKAQSKAIINSEFVCYGRKASTDLFLWANVAAAAGKCH